MAMFFFFSSRRRHTRYWRDWSSDVCSSDLKVRLYIENAKTELPKIMKQALNRASSMTRTYQSQLIRLGYHVKAEVVRGKIQFKSSTNELKNYIIQDRKSVV